MTNLLKEKNVTCILSLGSAKEAIFYEVKASDVFISELALLCFVCVLCDRFSTSTVCALRGGLCGGEVSRLLCQCRGDLQHDRMEITV